MPRDESLVRPGSHCPQCGAAIRNRHNIPVLGWLLLRGKCADCGNRISVRYPLVEAGTAALFVAVTARFGFSWELPAYLYLAAVAIALAMIDLGRSCGCPTRSFSPRTAVALVLLTPAVIADRSWAGAARGLIAAGLLYAFYWFLAVLPGGMGGGDVKLAPAARPVPRLGSAGARWRSARSPASCSAACSARC